MSAPDQRIGRFRLFHKTNSGSLGDIWLAEEQLGPGQARMVVVKKLLNHFLEDAEFFRRLRESVEQALPLHHENIVETYGITEAAEDVLISLEYVSGQSLGAVLTRARMLDRMPPISFSAWIISQLCRALEYAQRPHREISPGQVMISYRGEVKLLGFAPAPPINYSGPGIIRGRFDYMSPEQVMGEQLDPRTDIFTLGTVLWELCTGKRCFHSPSSLQSLERIRDVRIDRPSKIMREIPRELEAVILRAMQKKRADRFQSPAELRLALAAWCGDSASGTVQQELEKYLSELFAGEIMIDKQRIPGAAPKVERDEFEACIIKNPTALGPYLVYADWLQQIEDPRGELIVLDHALRGSGLVAGFSAHSLRRNLHEAKLDERKAALAARERDLLFASGRWLLDGLASASRAVKRAVWMCGFIAGATIDLTDHGAAREAIAALASSASGRFLRVLRLQLRHNVGLDRDLGLSRLACLDLLELRTDGPSRPSIERAVALRGLDQVNIRVIKGPARPAPQISGPTDVTVEETGPTAPARPAWPL